MAEHDQDRIRQRESADDAAEQSREDDVAPGAPSAVQIHRTVRKEGQEELDRPFWALTWSGIAAGIAINTSLLAEGALHNQLPQVAWREALVSLGYPIGFLLVILGRLQLFTESTVTAMLPLATQPSWRALRQTLRLWGIVILANLIGTAISGAATTHGLLVSQATVDGVIAVSRGITELGFTETLINGVPAGFLIAMIAWILPNARSQSFWVIFLITYIVALGGFSHSIVGSDEAFVLMFAGITSPAQTLFGLILPALIGNLLGGAGLFALLAHAQVRSDVSEEN